MEERRIKCKSYNASLVGLIAIANTKVVKDSGTISYNPIWASELGFQKRGDAATCGSVVGRLTGYTIDSAHEVRLFNPIWQPDGTPNYYFLVDVDRYVFLKEIEATAVARPVYRDFASRDCNIANQFPHVAIDYKTVCYDLNFESLGHWNRIDASFRNANWHDDYMTQFMPSFAVNNNNYTYKGDDYNPATGVLFSYFNTEITRNVFKAMFDAYWPGKYITQLGVCYSSVNALPTVADSRIYNHSEVYKFEFDSDDSADQVVRNLAANTVYYFRQYMIDENGTVSYGAVKELRTLGVGKKPVLLIDIPNSSQLDLVTSNSAKIVVRCFEPGDSAIISHGIKIGLTVEEMEDVEIVDVSLQRWEANLTGLMPNTRYYVQAWATNADGTTTQSTYYRYVEYTPGWEMPVLDDTGYFTSKVTTSAAIVAEMKAMNVGETTVRLGGLIASNGGSAVTEIGFVLSLTNRLPTISDKVVDVLLSELTGENTFYTDITGLIKSRKYFYRAYARTIKGGYSYSSGSSNFTTGGVDISTALVSSISKNTAICGGVITSSASQQVTERGVCFSKNPSPTIADNKTLNGSGVGAFSSALSALTPSTTYYVRAYATTSIATYYGNEVIFVTSADSSVVVDKPIVSTLPITNLTMNSAMSGYKLISTGLSPIIRAGVGVCIVPNPTYLYSFDYSIDGGDNNPVLLQGMEPGVNYFMIAYAENSEGISFGNAIPFRTLTVPTDEFDVEQNIVYDPVNNNCAVTVTADAEETIAKYGVILSLNADPKSAADAKIKSGTSNVYSYVNEFVKGIVYLQSFAENTAGLRCYSEPQAVTNPGLNTNPIATSDDILKFPVDNLYIGKTHSHKGRTWKLTDEGWVLKSSITSQVDQRTRDLETSDLFLLQDNNNLKASDAVLHEDDGVIYLKLFFDQQIPYSFDRHAITLKCGDLQLNYRHFTFFENNRSIVVCEMAGGIEADIASEMIISYNDIILSSPSSPNVKLLDTTEGRKIKGSAVDMRFDLPKLHLQYRKKSSSASGLDELLFVRYNFNESDQYLQYNPVIVLLRKKIISYAKHTFNSNARPGGIKWVEPGNQPVPLDGFAYLNNSRDFKFELYHSNERFCPVNINSGDRLTKDSLVESFMSVRHNAGVINAVKFHRERGSVSVDIPNETNFNINAEFALCIRIDNPLFEAHINYSQAMYFKEQPRYIYGPLSRFKLGMSSNGEVTIGINPVQSFDDVHTYISLID